MTEEQYKVLNNVSENHAIGLMINESKNSARTGFPRSNFIDYNPHQKEPKYFIATTNIFKAIIFDENYLANVAKENPECFGTGDAYDVLRGILQMDECFRSVYTNQIKDFAKLLTQAHGYVCKLNGLEAHPEVLRIDLFREIKPSKNDSSKQEFVGGLFHSFKHFSINEINLSTGNDTTELTHTLRIISFAIKAFHECEREPSQVGFNSRVRFNSQYDLQFCFYKNDKTNTVFINTIYKKKRQ